MRFLPKSFASVSGLLAALAIVFLLFTFLIPGGRFASMANIETLARQSCIIALVAFGMTYVIVSGGIDLSVGSIAAFSSVCVAYELLHHANPWFALACGILAGSICGLINGFLITRLKVGPFIVTLGTLLIVRAVGKGVAHEQKIDAPDSWIGDLLSSLGDKDKWHLLPWGVWLTLVLALGMGLALRYTRFGRYVVALGSNENAARLCGVPIDRVRICVFILSGCFAGLAGVMLFSRLTVGDPTVAQGMELDAIAAVVIGGASLSGGEGSILGALIGALIMQTIRSGGAQMGLQNWIQEIVTGSIIILAVALDRWRARRSITSA